MLQLIVILHNKCQAFDNMLSCIVFCDVSKAFDRVRHTGLLFKLRQNAIKGDFLFFVYINDISKPPTYLDKAVCRR